MRHFWIGLAIALQTIPVLGSMEEIRCQLNLSRLSGERQAAFDRGTEPVLQLIDQGWVPGYTTHLKTAFVDRMLPVLVPTAESLERPAFTHWLDQTMGILWRDTTGVGEILGHAYVRVADRIYDLQIAGAYQSEFQAMMRKRFEQGFTMRDREGRTPYYETVFPLSDSARSELTRYFEDRVQGRATLHGRPVEVHWVTGARGYFREDGVLCENCGAFSSSFAHPHWWVDYPGLKQVVLETGLVHPHEGANSSLRYLFDAEAHALSLVVWDVPRENHLWERHRILDTTGWEYHTE